MFQEKMGAMLHFIAVHIENLRANTASLAISIFKVVTAHEVLHVLRGLR